MWEALSGCICHNITICGGINKIGSAISFIPPLRRGDGFHPEDDISCRGSREREREVGLIGNSVKALCLQYDRDRG